VWSTLVGGGCSFLLNTVFRQSDVEFVEVLNSIRWGNVTGM
jgi:hypothetical protein